MESFEKRIQNEVQKTLSVPDHIKRVEGNPYLLTRVKAQLKEETKNEVASPTNLVWVGLTICLLLINSFVLFHSFSTPNAEVSALNELLSPSTEQNNWYEYLN